MGISLFIGRLVTPYAEKAFASFGCSENCGGFHPGGATSCDFQNYQAEKVSKQLAELAKLNATASTL